mgnify:CR=1 FL=1
MNLRVKYILLRESTIFLGMAFFFGMGGTLFSLGEGKVERAILYSCLMGGAYYISERLGWATAKTQIELVIKELQSKED